MGRRTGREFPETGIDIGEVDFRKDFSGRCCWIEKILYLCDRKIGVSGNTSQASIPKWMPVFIPKTLNRGEVLNDETIVLSPIYILFS